MKMLSTARAYGCLAAVLAVVALAGCGSSSSGDQASSSSDSGGQTSSTTSSSGGESTSGTMAAVEAEFMKDQNTPEGPQGLPKISKTVPSGKAIDFIHCGPSTCLITVKDFEAAVKLLDWHVKSIDAGETPSSQQAAFNQAVQEKPAAVVVGGLDPELFTKQIEALKSAKIPVVLEQVTNYKEDPPHVYQIPGPSHYTSIIKALAAATVQAGGEEAEVAFIAVPAFPIYSTTIDPGFKAAVASLCPKCTVNEYQLPVSALGKNATALITNFVRAHPGTNVVVNDIDVTSLGLEAALKGAGVTNVKDVGLFPGEANDPNLAAETEYALIPDPYEEITYLVADSLARVFTGSSPAPDINADAAGVIFTKDNLPEYSQGHEPVVVPGLEAMFKEIWGK